MSGQEVRVRAGTVVDRLDTPEGTVVLVEDGPGHRVVRLSDLGVAVLDVLDVLGVLGTDRGAVGMDALVEALVNRLGEPAGGGADDLARRAVAALATERVVEVVDDVG